MKLPRAFYDRPTLDVARDLLGLVLVHNRRGVRTSGIIVEVEAYIGETDPACHAAPGPTRRNAPLYGTPGHAYVYLNYGIHSLVNVVTEAHGSPAAVLIRALDPLEGIDVMRRRRARAMRGRRALPDARALPQHEICRGPGNLTMAMGITLRGEHARSARRSTVRRGPRHPRRRHCLGLAHRDQSGDRASVAGMGHTAPGGLRKAPVVIW